MRRWTVFVLGGVVAAAVAWWLLSPLFISQRVDEGFPLGEAPEIPEGMTESEAEATMAAAAADDSTAMEPMDDEMMAAQALAQGSFRDVDRIHRGSGEATIYRLADGTHVLRLEDLDVTNGPDLVVALSGHPDPEDKDELHEGFVEVARLKGNLGDQNYELPDEVEPGQIGSVAIYCRAFGVLFSVAPVQRVAP